MTSDRTVYAGWQATSVPDMLNGADHFAYVIGYPDGQVKPGGSITRAEVATIFFRLLKQEIRDGNLTRVNGFTDVQDGSWFQQPVSTMSALGHSQGADGGTLRAQCPHYPGGVCGHLCPV